MPTAAPIATFADVQVVPGRECGNCTLCCKVYYIAELDKPAGKWCTHCTPGKGCKIHDTTLPDQCAAFNCLWRTEEAMPLHWKPDQSRMVITIFPLNRYIYVQVDAGTPSAWRKQPYYDELHEWAKKNLDKGIHVIVFVNDIATLIMPDDTVPLGPMKPTDQLTVRRNVGAGAAKYEATLTPG
jgi:hypothetical protein